MIDVLVVIGTRPELVKTMPVVTALRAHGVRTHVVLTGQHSDLLDAPTLARLGPVEALGVRSDGNVTAFLTRAQRAVNDCLKRAVPRVVLVQGDTMSAYAGALAAQAVGIPVAHVEAGVRSGDAGDPWPEELIRVGITGIATWHFAATMQAAANVSRERTEAKTLNCEIMLTGNPGIDALHTLGVKSRLEASPTVLITLHRRELRDRNDVLDVLRALAAAIANTPTVQALWPVHPAMRSLVEQLQLPPNLSARGPLGYGAMIHALAEARGVVTDSGGLVEEAATLGVPIAVLRNVTDRPEAEAEGIAQRFPTTPAGATAAWATVATCSIERKPTDIYGDGHAALWIARHLAKVVTPV